MSACYVRVSPELRPHTYVQSGDDGCVRLEHQH